MRYYEIISETSATNLFYHGSKKEFPIGFILTPQPDGYVHGTYGDESDALIRKVEKILEQNRPVEMISRFHSVFLVANPAKIEHAGGHANFIYMVVPEGAVEESCLWWYQELESLAYQPRLDRAAAKQAALNYWHNVAPPDSKPATHEFRCRQARVVKQIYPRPKRARARR